VGRIFLNWMASANVGRLRGRQDQARAHPVRVLDEDPQLGRWLNDETMRVARRQVVIDAYDLPAGRWVAQDFLRASPPPLGVLILDGFLTHAVLLGGRRGLEILGPGDVLHPWEHYGSYAPVPFEEVWTVVDPARVAVLDRHFEATCGRLPGVMAELMDRATRRTRSVALHRAVTQLSGLRTRVLVMLWYIADRWGRVGPEGVLVPLRLHHQTLADLVGCRRPSLTVAINELIEAGAIARKSRGWIRLLGDPPQELREALPADRFAADALLEPDKLNETAAPRFSGSLPERAAARAISANMIAAIVLALDALVRATDIVPALPF
jgi:CRP/FNR family transcriptional regulator, cyclic AMP receptor protein